MNISSIIFDLDGVLWDSTLAHRKAFSDTFRHFGIDDSDWNYEKFAGRTTRETISEFLGSSMSQSKIQAIITYKQNAANNYLLTTEKPLFNNLLNTLTRLKEKYRLVICTSSSKRNLDTFLDLSFSRDIFDFTICGDDLPQAKPNPLIYEKAIANLSLPKTEIVIVEDSKQGIQAALDSHCHVIHFCKETCKVEFSGFTIYDISNLLDLENETL